MTHTGNTTKGADVATAVLDLEHEILEVGYLAQLAADLGTTDTLHKESILALSGPLMEYADDLRTKWREAHTAAVAAREQAEGKAPKPDGANDQRLVELEQRYYRAKAATNALPPDADLSAAQQREYACLDSMAAIQPDGAAGYAAIARTLAANRRDLDISMSEQATKDVERALIERCLAYVAAGGTP